MPILQFCLFPLLAVFARLSAADAIVAFLCICAAIALVVIVRSYAIGLRDSPRDLWLLYGYKIVEFGAYAATNLAVVLWLSKDCGLGDIEAGSFISAWSISLSLMGMFAGALVDTIGIRRTMLLSVGFLIISRVAFAFITNPVWVFILAFLPFGFGTAIVGPLVNVAIKRYTTRESAALGFGLFYVLMNVAYAGGSYFFDWIRERLASRDTAGKILEENAGMVLLGHHFSTYQMIFVFGLGATCASLVISWFVRDGMEMNDDGETVVRPVVRRGRGFKGAASAMSETWATLSATVREPFFRVYMGLLSLTLFVRFVFFHFYYTFPKYGIRVFGEGAKIGSIYGVLNPVLIIFLVPLVASMTRRTSSYRMMIIGSAISSLSCFITVLPSDWFAQLTGTVLGELIFVKWLGMAPDMTTLMANPPNSEYWPLILFIVVFTIGEAIWSPRLTQFTAEIAPKGREGTYISLSLLPFFVAKFFVGPMSGWLVKTYTPLDAQGKALAIYPNHGMVWVWIGAIAILSPVGLLVFRKWFVRNTLSETST